MSDLTGEPIVRIRELRKTYISKERQGILRGMQQAIEAIEGIGLEIYPRRNLWAAGISTWLPGACPLGTELVITWVASLPYET